MNYIEKRILFSSILLLLILFTFNTAFSQSNCNAKFKAVPNHLDTACYFMNQSSGGMTHYFWDFGDGSYVLDYDKINHTHKYDLPGRYTVKLTVWDLASPNPCEDTYIEDVVITDTLPSSCWAGFDYNVTDSLTIVLEDTSEGEYHDYLWDMGNGELISNKKSIEYTYQQAHNPIVTLKILNNITGKIDVEEKFVVLNETYPGVYFEVLHIDSITHTISFDDSITGNITSFLWDFGDGTTSTEPSPEHTYSSPGVYNVIFTGRSLSKNGEIAVHSCSKNVFVRVPEVILPSFNTYNQLDEKKTYIYNRTIAPKNSSLLWSSGDGRIFEDIDNPIQYNDAGNYTISLRVDDGMQSGFLYKEILVGDNHEVAPEFVYIHAPEGGVQFYNTTQNQNTQYYWDFDDGSPISTEQNPIHYFTSEGLHTVYLKTVTGDFETHYIKIVNVYSDQIEPFCDFKFLIDSVYNEKAFGPIKYKGVMSRTVCRVVWEPGDSEIDTVSMDFVKYYQNYGTFEVCFTVYDDFNGTSYTMCKTVDVPQYLSMMDANALNQNILIYPNPASHQIKVLISNEDEAIELIKVCTIDGKEINQFGVKNRSQYIVDVSNYLEGIYIVYIKSNKGTYAKKMQIVN